MGLRKAVSYSKRYARPYTRKSKVKSQNYIKTIPQQKIVKFDMGNKKAFETGDFKFIFKVISKEDVKLRDNAIEACRQVILKDIEKIMPGAYYFAIKKFPHHILRENRMFSGGSKGERVNQGMQQSFGSSVGRAAFVKKGEVILLVAFGEEKYKEVVRNTFRKIKSKFACGIKLVLEKKK